MNFRDMLFRGRSYTPVPFVLVALVYAEYDLRWVIIGGMHALIGEWLRIKSHRFIGGATRTREVGAPALVTSGPYGRVRNPLYLGNLLIYVGFSIASGAIMPYLPIAVGLFFMFQYGMIISLEEQTLIKLFGNEYQEYCRRVPRLMPNPFRRQSDNVKPNKSIADAIRLERRTLQGFIAVWVLLAVKLVWF